MRPRLKRLAPPLTPVVVVLMLGLLKIKTHFHKLLCFLLHGGCYYLTQFPVSGIIFTSLDEVFLLSFMEGGKLVGLFTSHFLPSRETLKLYVYLQLKNSSCFVPENNQPDFQLHFTCQKTRKYFRLVLILLVNSNYSFRLV